MGDKIEFILYNIDEIILYKLYKHKEVKKLNFRPKDLFSIVLDIDTYPEFIPWCKASRVKQHGDGFLYADMVINYKGIDITYESKVIYNSPQKSKDNCRIEVSHISGPFKILNNIWEFKWNESENVTELTFSIEFEMSSKILNGMIGIIFEKVVHKMVQAFESRANDIL